MSNKVSEGDIRGLLIFHQVTIQKVGNPVLSKKRAGVIAKAFVDIGALPLVSCVGPELEESIGVLDRNLETRRVIRSRPSR